MKKKETISVIVSADRVYLDIPAAVAKTRMISFGHDEFVRFAKFTTGRISANRRTPPKKVKGKKP